MSVEEYKAKIEERTAQVHLIEKLLVDMKASIRSLNDDLMKICDHSRCNRERYYACGMHSAEYTYSCLECGLEVSYGCYERAKIQTQT